MPGEWYRCGQVWVCVVQVWYYVVGKERLIKGREKGGKKVMKEVIIGN